MTLVVGLLAVVFLMTIGALLDAERDTIQFRPSQSWFPKSDYWTKKNVNKSWILRLLPIWDGWHLCKFIYHTCLFIVIAILMQWIYDFSYLFGALIVISLHLFYGAIFESTYGD